MRRTVAVIYVVVTSFMFACSEAVALAMEEAIVVAADRLVSEQLGSESSDLAGSWQGESGLTGSIVPGIIRSYLIFGTDGYKASAELGGDYILRSAGGNFYGDEAYALVCLSSISDDPTENIWRTELEAFYRAVKESSAGTSGYVAWFGNTDPSNAVFYLAHHTVAAYYVEASDCAVWREGLITFLARIKDGYCQYPVGAVGIAVWALAQTGPMDGTLVDSGAATGSFWHGITLEQLPDLVAAEQVPQEDLDCPGSFYARFDHFDDQNLYDRGYTEDTIFCVLGLKASAKADSSCDYQLAIRNAQDVLAYGVASDGVVNWHSWHDEYTHYTFAGETLHALPIPGDMDRDDHLDLADIVVLSWQWLAADCSDYHWCQGADVDHSGVVNLNDLATISKYWLLELE